MNVRRSHRVALAGMALSALLAFACRSASTDPSRAADNAVPREAFVAAFNRGDVAALKAFYAPDALLLTFTGAAVSGSDKIAHGLQDASAEFDLELAALRSGQSGNLMYEAGTWHHLEKGTTNVRETGTYLWVWREQAGRWLIDTHAVNRAKR